MDKEQNNKKIGDYTDSANPYVVDGKNVVLPSFCIYMDILGLINETMDAFEKGKGQELFNKLDSVLLKTFDFIKDDTHKKWSSKKLWQHKIFTDNVVLGLPIGKNSDGESEFGVLISQLIYYQLLMAVEGFFVRGSFCVGQLHVGEELVYGPAIIEAYTLENKFANNPRIIFSERVMAMVKKHLKYYKDPKDSPQNSHIMIDADGQQFVNYLYAVIDNDENAIEAEIFKKHKYGVEEKLNRFQEDSRIWSKYLWAANYHNYFCKSISHFPDFNNDFFIDTSLMMQEPKRLVD